MLPANHPLRLSLANEVHARPPELLVAPLRLSYLAVYSDWDHRAAQWAHVCALVHRYDVKAPEPHANHFSADLGPFRVKWELHAEFARYTFIAHGVDGDLFANPALDLLPADWVASIPGELLVAAHVVMVPGTTLPADYDEIAHEHFAGNAMVGAGVAGGAGAAFTDFRIHADGFSRFLVADADMTPRQAGRTVQRLLEIETYRMLALLALPMARELAPVLLQHETELSGITQTLSTASDTEEQPLLQRLTSLEAAIESRQSTNSYRFSAAAAYHELVQQRTDELREQRIQGLQTFREFMERRLAPAMNTCSTTATRQESLSLRVSRVSQLLSTRVDLTHERQNQSLLASMDRRAKLQLRLQETVEGLSIAAITYYIISLVGYVAKALKAFDLHLNPELVMGLSIPVVVALLLAGARRTRRLIQGGHDE